MLDQVRSKLKKRKMGDKEKDNLDEKMTTDASENPKQESASAEYKRLKREMMETKRKKDNEGKKHSESKESDVLAAFHAEQVTYLEKKKAAQKRKGEGRDEQNLALLASFQAKLEQSPEEDEEDDGKEKLQKEDEEGDDTGWMFHTLSCENELKRARDAFIEDEDTFEIYDPRNPINKRRRESSKKSLQSKRR
ncbi:spliceosome-associated protein CWC27 homolog [Montipora capricornis]|uniref:spliceosome-associated protein CWC27 homolog n=1 Tax=Montipora capricornis TaxID=246305 RepID=UPI0035F11DDA